jgi:hypothetical protein
MFSDASSSLHYFFFGDYFHQKTQFYVIHVLALLQSVSRFLKRVYIVRSFISLISLLFFPDRMVRKQQITKCSLTASRKMVPQRRGEGPKTRELRK